MFADTAISLATMERTKHTKAQQTSSLTVKTIKMAHACVIVFGQMGKQRVFFYFYFFSNSQTVTIIG